jgi:hypothetical protein
VDEPAETSPIRPPSAMPDLTVVAEPEPHPAYARLADPLPAPPMAGDDLYRLADFSALAGIISPDRFYDPSYDTTLITLIGHVLMAEAPIAETLFVQRIARAHGFHRAGRIIRDRVMALAERLHFVEPEPDGGRFIWINATTHSGWNRARSPGGPDDIRQIEEIALAELSVGRVGQDAAEVARHFGIRRLSAAARARIEGAQSDRMMG